MCIFKDCLNLLEKRVKSRFSHRIIRVASPSDVEAFKALAKTILTAPIALDGDTGDTAREWMGTWDASVEVSNWFYGSEIRFV
jgi:origin recognition complex subunit 4